MFFFIVYYYRIYYINYNFDLFIDGFIFEIVYNYKFLGQMCREYFLVIIEYLLNLLKFLVNKIFKVYVRIILGILL